MSRSASQRDDSSWPVEDSGFLRVILGPDDEKPYLGGRIRVLSVELYREGILFTWLAHSLPEEVYDEVLRRPDVVEELEREAGRHADAWRDLPEHIQDHNARFLRDSVLRTRLRPRPPRATDEHGNEYCVKMYSLQGTWTLRGTVHLTPGLRHDADLLTIDLGGAKFTLDV